MLEAVVNFCREFSGAIKNRMDSLNSVYFRSIKLEGSLWSPLLILQKGEWVMIDLILPIDSIHNLQQPSKLLYRNISK